MSELLEFLKKFITQAHEGKDTTTKQYPKTIHGLRSEVSFGRGNRADVAWICLLKDNEEVQNGYYPGFYYDWRNSLLFLVLGISEREPPSKNWSSDLLQKYPDFRTSQDTQYVALRYPQSRPYQKYKIDTRNISKSLENQIQTIENDLETLLKYYITPSIEEKKPAQYTFTPLFELLQPYILRFKEEYSDLEDETGTDEMTGSQRREWMKNRVQKAFSRENIDLLKKDEAIDILANFYSIEYGGGGKADKNSHIQWASGIIQQGFIEKAKDLLYGEGTFPDRYVKLIEIGGLKHGIASEFLCYYNPHEYGMILKSSEKALSILGLNQIDIPKTGQRAGEYALAFFDRLKRVLSVLRKDPFFSQADLLTLDYFLYFVSQSQFWRIAGGKNGTLWQDRTWQQRGIASYGAIGIEDVLKDRILTASDPELHAAYRTVFPRKSKPSEDETVRLLNIFLHKINIGDILIVNKGKTAVLGYGIVKSIPKFSENETNIDLKINLEVIWVRKNDNIPIPEGIKDKFEQIIGYFDYKSFKKIYSDQSSIQRSYWKIAPGQGAIYENLWYEKSIISVGWEEFFDDFQELLSLKDLPSFQTAFLKIVKNHQERGDEGFNEYTSENKVRASSALFWRFIHGVNIGDMIVANRGMNEVIAIGEVTSDVNLDKSMKYPYYRSVNWLFRGLSLPKPPEISGNWQNTIEPLTEEDFHRIMELIDVDINVIETQVYRKIRDLLSHKKQIILYGPPGTGKTYHANKFINSNNTGKYILSDKSLLDQRVYVLVIFPTRDVVVTDLRVGDIFKYQWSGRRNWQKYFEEIQEGDNALTYLQTTHQLTSVVQCIQKENDSITFKVVHHFKGPTYKDMCEDSFLKNTTMGRTTMSFSLKGLSEGELDRIIKISQGLTYEILGITLDKTEEVVKNQEFVTFHPSFGYEDFIEGLRPYTKDDGSLCYRIDEGIFKKFSRQAFNVLLKNAEIELEWTESDDIPQLSGQDKEKLRDLAPTIPFYLVIDEINRGDISRIFGELISLLEADKRYCEENELITTLPYSKQKFSIPPNLFIIGTMNTADRSISLVDIALRRRFGFMELMPDIDELRKIIKKPEIQDISDIAVDLLETINNKIVAHYDRDHQIGHSYFSKIKDASSRQEAIEMLHFAWYHEIIPLFQEYFYDAPRKLEQIIGSDFVKTFHEDRSFEFQELLYGEDFLNAVQNISKGVTRPDIPMTEE